MGCSRLRDADSVGLVQPLLTQQPGGMGGLLQLGVVFRAGFDKAAGALQFENGLVLRVVGVELEKGLADLLAQRRFEFAAYTPAVVEVGRGGGNHAYALGVDPAAR